MAVVFLIGGTGNQFFQHAASAPEDMFSSFFLNPMLRRALKWTNHEQILQFPWAPKSLQVLALITLVLDVLLARLVGVSLFSTLDTRHLKMLPRLAEISRFGYFQGAPERRDPSELARQIAPSMQRGVVALHIRGGDLLRLELAGNNVYGLLSAGYYRESLAEALEDLQRRSEDIREILVLTDDPDYAATFDLLIDGVPYPRVIQASLKETLELATGADWFISSNSTLSNWIVRLRKGVRSFAPFPFQKRADIDLPARTRRTLVNY